MKRNNHIAPMIFLNVMLKYMKLTALFFFISFSAFAQDKVYRVHTDTDDTLLLIRYKHSATIPVRDGLVYKWKLPASDTARFFNATDGQYEATVTFRKLGTTPDPDPEPVIETIDNIQMTAANGWTRNGATTSPGWYDNTTAWSAAVGATISYTFTGTKVDLYAERKNTHGKGQIIIMDGTTEVSSVEVDFSLLPHGLQVLIWASPTLPRKQYTFTLRVNSGVVLADKLVITK